ncbi:response regulator [Paenibacillus sp. GCM10027626]|uniref:response regulator n=1 Tax=Paenibacillus sp. GCM10027626 TaxID=3273411 RepID=UPI003628B0F8
MYDIIIVDDEAVIREAILELIDWNSHGFNCVAHCENGIEALELAVKLRPAVVLTDISMPFMDGLEMARRLAEEHPRCRIVFLTGYDDFEYARQAVKLKADDYMMKPITAAELRALLDKIRNELDEERSRLEDMGRLRRQLNESLPLLRERFLERLATSGMSKEEADERLAYFDIGISGTDYIVLAIDPDHFRVHDNADDHELLRFAVYNIVQELAHRQAQSAVFRSREERVMTIVSGVDAGGSGLEERAQQLAEEIREAAETYLDITVTVGIGRKVGDLRELGRSSRDAVTALDYRLLLGNNRVISISDMEGRESARTVDTARWEKKLISGIRTGTEEEVETAISEIFCHLQHVFPAIDRCYIQIQKIILALIQTVVELGGSEADAFGPQANPLTDIYAFTKLGDIEDWLKAASRSAIRSVAAARTDYSHMQMLQAETYIREHYDDPDLSLKMICQHLHMSASYFSLMFKQHTGQTFVEFLTAHRIGKARELLKFSDLKTYEIAEKVGYRDPHYFSMLFKKTTGQTPKEHRQKVTAE